MSETITQPAPGAPAVAAPPPSPAPAAPVAFAEQLPADIRGEAVFANIDSLDKLAKGYLHAQRMIGVPADRVLKLPDAPDSPDWAGVWAKLGRPEAPDKYELTDPDGIQADAEFKSAFLRTAHESGLTATQARKLFDWYGGEAKTRLEAVTAQQRQVTETNVAALRQEWGAAFDQKLTQAKAALQHYADPAMAQLLERTGLGNDPAVVRMFAKLGAQLAEDGVIGRAAAPSSYSPAEATQQINARMADPTFRSAYLDKRHPQHAERVAEMARLYEMKAAAAA